MTLLDSMHNSEQANEMPRPGSRLSAISQDEDIEALLADITGSPTVDLYDEEDAEDVDVPESLDAIVRNLPAELQPDSEPKKEESKSDDASDDLEEPEEAEELTQSSGTPKKYIMIMVVILAVLILVVIIGAVAKKKEPTNTSTPGIVAPTTFYADQLTLTDGVTYQDSMVVEKYIELDQDACVFVFRGYAEQARAFVTAYVDIDTYNRYKTGARVPILYEHITINGEDYYMKVRLNYED